jgi:hypothetical protein
MLQTIDECNVYTIYFLTCVLVGWRFLIAASDFSTLLKGKFIFWQNLSIFNLYRKKEEH